jgi:hypothetical protein
MNKIETINKLSETCYFSKDFLIKYILNDNKNIISLIENDFLNLKQIIKDKKYD